MSNYVGPIGKYLEEKGITTNQAAKMTGIAQPSVWRHATGKHSIAINAMEIYNQVFKIPFKEMRLWNKQRKEQHGQREQQAGPDSKT